MVNEAGKVRGPMQKAADARAEMAEAVQEGRTETITLDDTITPFFLRLPKPFLLTHNFTVFMESTDGQVTLTIGPETRPVAIAAFQAWQTHPDARISGSYVYSAYLSLYKLFQASLFGQGQELARGIASLYAVTLGNLDPKFKQLTLYLEIIRKEGSLMPQDQTEFCDLLSLLYEIYVPESFRKAQPGISPNHIYEVQGAEH